MENAPERVEMATAATAREERAARRVEDMQRRYRRRRSEVKSVDGARRVCTSRVYIVGPGAKKN